MNGATAAAVHDVPQPSATRRIVGRAISVLIMASLLVLVAAGAIYIKTNGGDWWAPTLPPLGALGLMLLGIVLRRPDETLAYAIARLVDLPVNRPVIGALVALVTAAGAIILALAARSALIAEDLYRVQVFETANVPGKRIGGVTVIMERVRDPKRPAIETRRQTDENGIASFPASVNDWFSVRLERDSDIGQQVYSLTPGDVVTADMLLRPNLVKIDAIPGDAWIKLAKAPGGGRTLGGDGVVGFLRADRYLFRWTEGLPQQAPLGPAELEATIAPFGVPPAEIVIRREAYVLGFSPFWRLPRWAASRVSHAPAVRRGNDRFGPDPLVPRGVQAPTSDYIKNPFDRGHLVRRSDVGTSSELAASVNLMTAITPQTGLFNRKVWLAIETFTSDLGKIPGHDVYVIRGPMFLPADNSNEVSLRLIGTSRLPVPTHFFQVAVDRSAEGMRMHCFIVPNESIYNDLVGVDRAGIVERYRASLDRIERETGLRLVPRLDRASATGC